MTETKMILLTCALGTLLFALPFVLDTWRKLRADRRREKVAAPRSGPKPVCKQCGQFLDSRDKCRVLEHNL